MPPDSIFRKGALKIDGHGNQKGEGGITSTIFSQRGEQCIMLMQQNQGLENLSGERKIHKMKEILKSNTYIEKFANLYLGWDETFSWGTELAIRRRLLAAN
jgi:hypothetical protein